MKKLLLIVFGLAVVFLVINKLDLLAILFKNSGFSLTNQKFENTSSEKVTPKIGQVVLGIHYRMIDSLTADQNNLIEGAYITQVIEDSLAKKANLNEEDIITKVDGIEISGGDEQFLTQLISKKKPGQQIDLEVWRNGVVKNILITLD